MERRILIPVSCVFFYGNELIPVKLLYDFYKIPAFQMGAFDLPICYHIHANNHIVFAYVKTVVECVHNTTIAKKSKLI